MSHADDILEIIKTLDKTWYTTREITDALKDYWESERVYSKEICYTHQALEKLNRRGEVEVKRPPYCKDVYWRVIR